MGREIRKAMASLTDANWTLDSPAIQKAQDDLDEQATRYVEGAASYDEVKKAYKNWSTLHRQKQQGALL